MSKEELTVCDFCDAETRDQYDRGWVEVDGHISLSRGHKKDKTANTVWLGSGSKWHFCSAECLVQRLKTGKKERP